MARKLITPSVPPSKDAIPGGTYDEALANAREAIELYIEDLRESGQAVPVDPAQGAQEWPTAAVAVNYA